MSEPIVYTLKSPITVGGETITTITLREPKVKELDRAQRRAEGSSMQVVIILLTLISGVSEAAIGEMGQRDWSAVNDILTGFTVGGPEPGAAA